MKMFPTFLFPARCTSHIAGMTEPESVLKVSKVYSRTCHDPYPSVDGLGYMGYMGHYRLWVSTGMLKIDSKNLKKKKKTKNR